MQNTFDNHQCNSIQKINLLDNLTIYDFVSDNQANPFVETYVVDFNEESRIYVIPKTISMELRSRISSYQNGDLDSLKYIRHILNL